MKKRALVLLIFITQLTFAQRINFKIIEDRTEVDDIEAITVHVEVLNNTKNDITILKPATEFNQKWRYYKSKVECPSDPTLWVSEIQIETPYTESDLLVITAKSKAEIIINGRKNCGSLSCGSKEFELQISYDASELINNLNTKNLNSNEIEILQKLTPIRIESIKTKIKML